MPDTLGHLSRLFKNLSAVAPNVVAMTHSNQASARFTVASWQESVEVDIDGEGTTRGDAYYPNRGVTRASVGYTYTGDIEGSSEVSYVFAYNGDEAPIFGLERFTGTIGGREGTCVFQHVGAHDATSVTAVIQVVAGMGTGDLAELRGEAQLSISGEAPDGYPFDLAYDVG
jgi:hypothetical protein